MVRFARLKECSGCHVSHELKEGKTEAAEFWKINERVQAGNHKAVQ